jgi:hypothetical protein
VQNVIIVIGQRIINDGLYRIKAGTVIDGEEGDASFRISAGTHPSAHGDFWSTATRPWSTSATGTTLIIFSLLIVGKNKHLSTLMGDIYVTCHPLSDK